MDIDKEYIDVDNAAKRVGGNKNLLVKLLGQFVEGDYLSKVEEAIGENDLEKAASAAHAIKGVSANLALTKLSETAAKLDKQLKNNEEYKDTYTALKEIYETTVGQIAKITEQGADNI